MTFRTEKYGDGSVTGKKIEENVLTDRYFYDRFHEPLRYYLRSDTTTLPTGSAGEENVVHTGKHQFFYNILGTQSIVNPSVSTEGGIDWTLDETAADGVEVVFGDHSIAGHPRNFVAGTDPDWFFRLRFSFGDVSGADLFVGWRKQEAVATALATFTDLAGIRVLGDSSSAAGAITIVTNLNDATDLTSTTTTATLADATAVEFEVRISQARKATFFINGVEYSGPAGGFTFDNADELCPVAYFLHTTDVGQEYKHLAVEGGPLTARRSGLLP